MIQEAIILAGGLGTRLKSVVHKVPKSLAPVAGKPFLEYLLQYAKKEGIEKFIFALGYKTELIEAFVNSCLPARSFSLSIEEEPLGTGGAIYQACKQVIGQHVIVLNADTFFGIRFSDLAKEHEARKADCTLALKPMQAFDRYGVVEMNAEGVISGFSEKKYREDGLVNGGIYALQVQTFLKKEYPPVFSFEQEYLQKQYPEGHFFGMISDAYFIDIGVPADYQRAQTELLQNIFS